MWDPGRGLNFLLPEDAFGVREEATENVDKVAIMLALASSVQYSEELVSVYFVKSLLKVDKEEASLVSHFKNPRDALRGALSSLEPVLIEASL